MIGLMYLVGVAVILACFGFILNCFFWKDAPQRVYLTSARQRRKNRRAFEKCKAYFVR